MDFFLSNFLPKSGEPAKIEHIFRKYVVDKYWSTTGLIFQRKSYFPEIANQNLIIIFL